MRKDAGLNGDLDRIPQLAWILFLRAFDGLEQDREITESDYRPAIEAPYRWRDWADDPDGRTGEALLSFVNGEMLPYLRELTGTDEHDPRDILAAVFRETNNRMLSGHLRARRRQQGLRDQLRVLGRHPHDGPPLRVDAA